MSPHLAWMIVRNNNAFLVKKRNIKKPFSSEPNNLTNLASFRYNGFVHKRSVGIEASPDKKGFTLVLNKAKLVQKPAISNIKITMRSGPKVGLRRLRKHLNKNRYRPDLVKAALRRASAILMAQKKAAAPAKKPRAKKAE